MKVFLIFLFLSVSAAHAATCEPQLVHGQALMFRPHTQFSRATISKYLAIRDQYRIADPHWTLAHGDQPASLLVGNIIQLLAKKSGLADCLENPVPISVVILRTDLSRALVGNMKSGILTLNRAMLDLAETDDELAEIIAHEMLHHTLAHPLLLIKLQNSYWYRAMGIGSESGGFSGVDRTAPWDYRNSTLKKAYDLYEREARLATIDVLLNAGFDPWALVTLWEKQVRYREQTEGAFANVNEEREIISESRAWLTNRGILPRATHGTEWIRRLRASLPQE